MSGWQTWQVIDPTSIKQQCLGCMWRDQANTEKRLGLFFTILFPFFSSPTDMKISKSMRTYDRQHKRCQGQEH